MTSFQLEKITKQVDAIEQKLLHRLPEQKQMLLAKLCAWKWMLKTIYHPSKLTGDLVDTLSRKVARITLDAGAYWYNSAEQCELLTNCLCELDNVLSEGDATIRNQRKAQVLRAQQLLTIVDIMKDHGETIKLVAKQWFSPYSEMLNQMSADCEHEEAQEESDNEMEESDDEMEESDDEMEEVDDEEESAVEKENKIDEETDNRMDEEDADTQQSRLPIWTPKCTVTQDNQAVYIRAFLHGIDESNCSISCDTKTGKIQVSGYKLPTPCDLQMTAFSGVASYGRFVIEKNLPTHLVDLEQARFKLQGDQVLEIRIPLAKQQHPQHSFSRSRFSQPRYSSWRPRRSYQSPFVF